MRRTLLFAATAAFSVNMMAESQVLYSQDFENVKVGNFTASVKNLSNVDPYYWSVDGSGATRISVANEKDHGNYLEIKQNDKNWAPGGAFSLFYTKDATKVGEDKDLFQMEKKGINKYTVEFDAAIYTTLYAQFKSSKTEWSGACVEFALLNTTFNVPKKRPDYGLVYGDVNTKYANVIFLKQKQENITSTKPTLSKDYQKFDESVSFSLMNNDDNKKVTLPTDGSWNHWKVSVDRSTGDVSLTIGEKEIVKFTADKDLVKDQILRGIFFRTGNSLKSDPSYVRIDNIKVTGEVTSTGINEVNARETDAAEKKTVKYVKNGVLYISTPNGTVTAAGVAVK